MRKTGWEGKVSQKMRFSDTGSNVPTFLTKIKIDLPPYSMDRSQGNCFYKGNSQLVTCQHW